MWLAAILAAALALSILAATFAVVCKAAGFLFQPIRWLWEVVRYWVPWLWKTIFFAVPTRPKTGSGAYL